MRLINPSTPPLPPANLPPRGRRDAMPSRPTRAGIPEKIRREIRSMRGGYAERSGELSGLKLFFCKFLCEKTWKIKVSLAGCAWNALIGSMDVVAFAS